MNNISSSRAKRGDPGFGFLKPHEKLKPGLPRRFAPRNDVTVQALEKNMTMIPQEIFRAYDIRGIADQQITEENTYLIGKAFAAFAIEKSQRQICVARDARLSGERLERALIQGLLDSGMDVIQLGVLATPVLYFATCQIGCPNGIMVTASHNPGNYNGFKFVLNGCSLTGDEIRSLYTRIQQKQFVEAPKGQWQQQEILTKYIDYVAANVHLEKPLTIVVDSGNGMGSEIAPQLFRRMGCTVHELYCTLDGRFPNHHPDPSRPENLVDLQKAVLEYNADVGLAFDGDADRLGVVTNKAEVIWPDRQTMLFAQAVLQEAPGSTILYDVKCSRHLDAIIKAAGGVPIMWKTGHSIMKLKLKESGAALGGEMSGHIFFKHRWFGFDDGIYTGARLLEILSRHPETSSEIFAQLPNDVSTPEINLAVPEAEKFDIVTRLIEKAQNIDAKKITLDGLRLEFAHGWALVRASNTSAVLVLRFEADDAASLASLQQQVKSLLLDVKPDLVINF